MKKLLAGLLSLIMVATIVATPLGENFSGVFKKSTLLVSAYEEDSSDVDSSETHEHVYKESILKNATCIEDGIKTFACECGEEYNEIIPAIGHSYKTTVVKSTYLDKGYTLHKCSLCGDEYKDSYLAKLILPNVTGFKSTTVTSNSVKLTWNKVKGANGYVIYQIKNGKWTRITKTTTNIKAYTINKLASGQSFKFAIRAYKTMSEKEVLSPKYPTLTSTTKLATVTGFKTSSVGEKSVKLSWNKTKNADGYIVYRYDNVKKSWVRVAKGKYNCTYTVSKLKSGTSYKFAVKAYKTVDKKEITSQKYPQLSTSTKPAKVSFNLTAGNKKATVKWSKVTGATGYKVYYKTSKNGKWKLIKTANNKTTSYTKSGLTNGKSYYFTVKAYRTVGGKTYNGGYSEKSIQVKVISNLYYINNSSNIYTKSKVYEGRLSGGGWYTGYVDPQYKGYIVLNYMSSEVLISSKNVSKRKNAKVLGTGSIGQYGGSIRGYAACGPTAVAILMNSEKGTNWSKDSLIRYSEKHGLNDQGSLRSGGGMTGPKLLKLIKGFSSCKYSAKNLYSRYFNSTSLKNQIDKGHRVLVVVRYTSTIVSYAYPTHFVVICGYEYINGGLYFYYADPYYGNGGRSLKRVSASLLITSMHSSTSKEPGTAIVLN